MEGFDFRSILKESLTPQGWVIKTYPQPHAEVCPICKGNGKIADTELEVIRCHGCDGKGWIRIE
jgi:DnaJ-class molecular chaperone